MGRKQKFFLFLLHFWDKHDILFMTGGVVIVIIVGTNVGVH